MHSLHLLVLSALLGHASARHAVLPNNEPALTDATDWTVDTQSTADLYSPMDTAKLFVTMRSPTTQLVVFSPDRMPIDRSIIASNSVNRTVYKLLLMQRACKMASGSTSPRSCYEQPFDTRNPQSPDRVFEFYRYAGTGGADPNDVLMMEASAAMDNGTTLDRQWMQRGFRGCPKLERQCNNHRAVSMRNGHPATLRNYRRIEWNQTFYNDAEFMEKTIFTDPPSYADAAEAERCVHRIGSCQWTPQTIEFLQEVLPIANGFEQAKKREGQWMGTYLNYRRLPSHLPYLSMLRSNRVAMPVVTLVFIAAGDVADYPRNVTADMKRRIALASGVPTFGVRLTVTAASVRITARVYVVSEERASNVTASLAASVASPATATAFTGFIITQTPNMSVTMPPNISVTTPTTAATLSTTPSTGGEPAPPPAQATTSEPAPPPAQATTTSEPAPPPAQATTSEPAPPPAQATTTSEPAPPPPSPPPDAPDTGSSGSGRRLFELVQRRVATSKDAPMYVELSDVWEDDEWELESDEELEEVLKEDEEWYMKQAATPVDQSARHLQAYSYGGGSGGGASLYGGGGGGSSYGGGGGGSAYGGGGGGSFYGGSSGASYGGGASLGSASYGGGASLGSASYGGASNSYEEVLPDDAIEFVDPTSVAPKINPTAGEQLHPNNLNVDRGKWDHHIEICAFEGQCDPNTASCINNYQVSLVTADAAGQPEVNVLYQEYKQFPAEGAGDLLALRATPDQGPYAPCPVSDDGRQAPCAPPEMMYRGARITGFVPPNYIRFYVDTVKVVKLADIGSAGFSLIVEYDIAWSDRYAVHPCKIPLYAYGKGVPTTGKLVPGNRWWRPDPAKGDNSALSFTHAPNLRVLHTVPTNDTDEVGLPGLPVTRACTVQTCPWPKQLFLKDTVKAEVSVSATWDLTQFPFDKQMLRMSLPLLDAGGFIDTPLDEALVDVTLPEAQALLSRAGGLYKKKDWTVYSLAIKLSTESDSLPHTIDFELKIARNSMSTVFKAVIPMFANGLLVTLAARMGNTQRLTVISLSMIGAGTMLNPAFLGLPLNVSGIPFIQSLVLIHMAISMVVLAYTLSIAYTDWYYAGKIEDHQRAYVKSMVGVWKKHTGIFAKWSSWLGDHEPPAHAVVDAAPAVPGFGDATFFDQFKTPALRQRKGSVKFVGTTAKTNPAPPPPPVIPQPQAQMPHAPELPAQAVESALKGLDVDVPSAAEELIEARLEAKTEVVAAKPPVADGMEQALTLQRATVELLLSLPALFHRQDPSRPPTIFNPFGELRPGHLPEYNKHLEKRGPNQERFEIVVPAVLILLWVLDVIVYFVVIDGEPK